MLLYYHHYHYHYYCRQKQKGQNYDCFDYVVLYRIY